MNLNEPEKDSEPRAVFRWHQAARLFAGESEIPRPHAPISKGFRALPSSPSVKDLTELGTALAAGDSFCVSPNPLPEDASAETTQFLTFTGGSTAEPKIIRRTKASWIASFEINAAQFNLTPQDSLAVLGELSHSLALYGLVEGVFLGLDTHVLAGMTLQAQVSALRQNRISVLYATPTQLRLLCKTEKDLPDLRLILCGGGALDAATASNIRKLCPDAALHQFYGAAETSFITMTDATTPAGSQGRPYPGVSLRILDETGAETSSIGEVWVRSPYLFDGYASNSPPIARTQDGYVSVGEIGHLDPHGNLHLTGRKSRRVTIADQSVYPDAVESHLLAQPDMPPCALLPVEDGLRGLRLAAVIEGQPDATLSQTLRQSCRDAFGALATPARVFFIEALPRLASGKTDLAALSKWLEDQT